MGRSVFARRRCFVVAVLFGAAGCTTESGSPAGPAPPAPIDASIDTASSTLSAGNAFSCGIVTTGEIHCWGSDYLGALGDARVDTIGDQSNSVPRAIATNARFTDVSSRGRHGCGVTAGKVMCWGSASDGAIRTNQTTGGIETPVDVPLPAPVSRVFAGHGGTCAITTTNELLCWGSSMYFGTGVAFPSTPTSARNVGGALRFASASVSAYYACALTLDGFAYCWGMNGFGESGAPVTTSSCTAGSSSFPCVLAPRRISDLKFVAIDAGGEGLDSHACALTTAGDAYCWGQNMAGQLGVVNTELCYARYSCSTQPIAVGGGLRFAKITAGRYHTCALTSDGTAYCWGGNTHGQLGRGGTDDLPHPGPAVVQTSLRFSTISAGTDHTCALTRDKRAYCWGANSGGAIGDGQVHRPLGTPLATPRPSAVVGGLTFR